MRRTLLFLMAGTFLGREGYTAFPQLVDSLKETLENK